MKNILILLIIVALILLNKKTINKKERFNDDNKCCLIEKKLASDSSGFYYDYNIVKCNSNDFIKFNSDLNERRLFDKNDFPINKCNKEKSDLGSCRKDSHECFDFFTKEKCNKFEKMIWNKVPCNMPINYVNKVEEYKIFDMTDININR